MGFSDPDQQRPVALVILDGWGYAPRTDSNAIATAHTPYYDEICRKFPMTTLETTAPSESHDVRPGNPELGHLNLGTGRAAKTEIERIKNAIADGEFFSNPVIERAFAKAKADSSAVHLIGLLSDGGATSSTESLFAFLRTAKKVGLKDVFVHCILDGVDVPPRTADIYVEALEIKLADIGIGSIASLCGRFFALDNTEHWERTARAFTMLVHAEGERTNDAITAIRSSFLRGIADEFISPIIVESEPDVPMAKIKSGDLVIFFNHRADNTRQLVRSICIPEGESGAKPLVDTICLTEYDPGFNLPVAFRQDAQRNPLVEVLSAAEIPTIKITESARYTHITDFFDGGVEDRSEREEYLFATPTNDRSTETDPESQSFKIVDKFRRDIAASPRGLHVINLPAAGLMAETGNIERTRAAIQYIDTCLGGICERMHAVGGVVLLTSTYGSCEEMVHQDNGEPNKAPTSNPVPFHYIDETAIGIKLYEGGSLIDVAPTILGILNVEVPAEMTGTDLRCI